MKRTFLGSYKLVDQEPPEGYKSNPTPMQDSSWGTDVDIYVFPKYDSQDKYRFYIDNNRSVAFTDQIFVDKDGINNALNKVDQQYRDKNLDWKKEEEERRQQQEERRQQQEERRRQEQEERHGRQAAEEAPTLSGYKIGQPISFKDSSDNVKSGTIKYIDYYKNRIRVQVGKFYVYIEIGDIISSGGMRKTKNKRRKQKRKTKRSKRRNNKSNKRKTKRSKRRNNK